MADSMMEWSVRDVREPMAPGSTVMDGWELKKLLGRGSFGNVWLAEKNLFGIRDRSAIKIILIPRDPDDIDAMRAEGFSEVSIQTELRRSVENSIREIRTMLDLQGHPAIVPYHGFDVIQYEKDDTWEIDIRMQLLTSLTDWLAANRITLEVVIRLGLSLSDLLSVCERENILHRDIKPANIFVDKLNNFKLGDFGLARVVSDSSSTHSRGVGTEAFMAPEVFRSGKYDHRADLYSLGLVMYWLLNNQSLPFTDETTSRSDAIVRRLSGELLPPLPAAGPALDRIIRKACDPDPEKRWKTAKEFHDALQNIALSTPETPEEPEPAPVREIREAPQEPPVQDSPKPKKNIWIILGFILGSFIILALGGSAPALIILLVVFLLLLILEKTGVTHFFSSRQKDKPPQADKKSAGTNGSPAESAGQSAEPAANNGGKPANSGLARLFILFVVIPVIVILAVIAFADGEMWVASAADIISIYLSVSLIIYLFYPKKRLGSSASRKKRAAEITAVAIVWILFIFAFGTGVAIYCEKKNLYMIGAYLVFSAASALLTVIICVIVKAVKHRKQKKRQP